VEEVEEEEADKEEEEEEEERFRVLPAAIELIAVKLRKETPRDTPHNFRRSLTTTENV
jgi:hypothetical protein